MTWATGCFTGPAWVSYLLLSHVVTQVCRKLSVLERDPVILGVSNTFQLEHIAFLRV